MKDYPKIIKNVRESFNESQSVFGERFGVSHAAVSDWESGKSEAPYKVIDYILEEGIKPVKDSISERIEILINDLSCVDCGVSLYSEYVTNTITQIKNIMSDVVESLRLEEQEVKHAEDIMYGYNLAKEESDKKIAKLQVLLNSDEKSK